jgi:hypothetical protein
MGSHGKKVDIDLSKGYEKNEIQLRGIILTSIALFLTCVVSFWLMWVLQNQMEEYWVEGEKQTVGPMDLKPEERLPPEPRLQGAPGFGIDDPTKGRRINLELKHPQAEWEELQKLWAEEEKNGQKVVVNGQETVVTLPIAEAKKRLLSQTKPAGEDIKKLKSETDFYFTSATSGRKPTGVKK